MSKRRPADAGAKFNSVQAAKADRVAAVLNGKIRRGFAVGLPNSLGQSAGSALDQVVERPLGLGHDGCRPLALQRRPGSAGFCGIVVLAGIAIS